MPTTVIRYIETGEAFVGASHPSLDDTLNRALRDLLSASGVDPDQPFDGFTASSVLDSAVADLEGADDVLTAALAAAVSTLEAADTALTASIAAKVASVSGTANRVTIGGTATAPTVDVASNYAGQTSIITLGTVTTGIWHGTAIDDTYLATIATAGKVSNAATTATANNTVNAIVARDANGDFVARNITATLFNGPATSANEVAVANVTGLLSGGKILTSLLPALAITDTFVVVSQAAMLALTAQTGDVAVRSDLNKSFILRGTDPTVLSDWQELLTPTDAVLSVAGKVGAVTLVSADITDATSTNTASRVVVRDGSGNFAAGTITAALTGNASTATALATGRAINGVTFDGTAAITVPAAAGTLSGTTLAANVVASSLTSVGVLASPHMTGAVVDSGGLTVSAGTTAVQALTATGLTVTAATGKIDVTSSTGTNGSYIDFTNTGGTYYFGVENSAGSIFGAAAYAAVIYTPAGLAVQFNKSTKAAAFSGIVDNAAQATGFAMGAKAGTRRISFSAAAFNFLNDADASAPIVVAELTATTGTFSDDVDIAESKHLLFNGGASGKIWAEDNGFGNKNLYLEVGSGVRAMQADDTGGVLLGSNAKGKILVSAAGTGETALSVWDDSSSAQRVSYGAADSGGSGYRLLRIPN